VASTLIAASIASGILPPFAGLPVAGALGAPLVVAGTAFKERSVFVWANPAPGVFRTRKTAKRTEAPVRRWNGRLAPDRFENL
jgi:hypothetical protein